MILVELDPIGADGQPSSTTVWCPACENIYRVPFEKRNSWLCACPMQRYAEHSVTTLLDLTRDSPVYSPPSGQLCEWVRIGPNGGRITTTEVEQAKREKRESRGIG